MGGNPLPSFQKTKNLLKQGTGLLIVNCYIAVYMAIKHFQHFVEGHQFYVVTDHKPLTFTLAIQFW